jgi:hypothetical protein
MILAIITSSDITAPAVPAGAVAPFIEAEVGMGDGDQRVACGDHGQPRSDQDALLEDVLVEQEARRAGDSRALDRPEAEPPAGLPLKSAVSSLAQTAAPRAIDPAVPVPLPVPVPAPAPPPADSADYGRAAGQHHREPCRQQQHG